MRLVSQLPDQILPAYLNARVQVAPGTGLSILGDICLWIGVPFASYALAATLPKHLQLSCSAKAVPPAAPRLADSSYPLLLYDSYRLRVAAGRGAVIAEDARGTPTQSHISPSILVYDGKSPEAWPQRAGRSARRGAARQQSS